MGKKWVIADVDAGAQGAMVSELGIRPITARVILNRGIASEAKARSYLKPSLSDIPDPFLIGDMDRAAKRIARAISGRERIAIFGDYDCDGITGTALLSGFLGAVGEEPIAALPHRMRDGFGLTREAVDRLHSQGAGLIVTVDNGMRACGEIDHARALGMDVVVTDHHSAFGELPRAVAVVNPQKDAALGACRDLSGSGVAFMLALALRKLLREAGALPHPEPNLRRELDLVALGTIADVAPLTAANRILVRHGLDEIGRAARPGIAALMEVSRTNAKTPSPDAVAFRLAPRINAAGRMGDARSALDLLLCDDPHSAREIARSLDLANRERQKIEGEIICSAMALLDADAALDGRSGVVLHSRGWHAGVIGIVAAKMAGHLERPVAVITLDPCPARGSVRGCEGMNLVEALDGCSDLLVRYGGHAMAAGLSIDASRLDEFRDRFDESCARLMPQRRPKALYIDAMADPAEIDAHLVSELESCRPFGEGNPEPVLAMRGVDILSRRVVGERHLKLRLRAGGCLFDSIGFGMALDLPASVGRASLAFCPELNTWNGCTSVQLKLKDIQFDSP